LDAYLERNVLNLLDKFTSDEINSIILILNSKGYIVNEELNRRLVELALNDLEDMSIDELILYLQSILSLSVMNKFVINKFKEIIFKSKFSFIQIYSFSHCWS
jgi:hypothetical protein